MERSKVADFGWIGRGNWKVRGSRILGAVIPFRRDTARQWALCCWVATEVGRPTCGGLPRSFFYPYAEDGDYDDACGHRHPVLEMDAEEREFPDEPIAHFRALPAKIMM
jgi:hypothetical protein